MGYLVLTGLLMLIGMIVSSTLKNKFHEYGQIALSNGLSGREVAERMLEENGIHDVRVTTSEGFLSDHYNPANKTVNLSPDVYAGRSISAAAVAAHECGHAVQHARAYAPLKMRSALVPIVQVSTSLGQWVLFAGLGVWGFGGGNQTLLLIGIIMFAMSTIFSLITLPVEYDASARALRWMENTRLTTGYEHDKAADALKWAARTYLVAAISSVAQLLYFVMVFMNRRDD
ncbi:MAG: zinc metallopeptidase [Taibaiella sp.]|nr:zinc metallopeptidase [Taibaiella sp.]